MTNKAKANGAPPPPPNALPSPDRRRDWLRFALALALSVAILLALCWKTQAKLGGVFGKIFEADVPLLFAAFGFSAAVHILVGAWKWRLILAWSGYRTTFAEALFVRMGSDPLRAVLPFKTGELGNAAYFWRMGRMTFAESLGWVAFDKALNIFGTFFWLAAGLAAMALSSASIGPGMRGPWLAIGATLAAASTAALLLPMVSGRFRGLAIKAAGMASAKLGGAAERALTTFSRIAPRRKAALLLLGVAFQLRPLVVCVLLFHAFRPEFAAMPSVPEFLASGSAVVASSNVPGPQWGTGPRETALAVLFRGHLHGAKPEPPFAFPPPSGFFPGDPTPLIAIGLLMGAAIHLAPAFVGLPVLAQFLNALRTGARGGCP